MQGIRILQSWNCVLEDCKVAKNIEIALLRCWEESRKAAATRRRKAAPSVRTVSCPTDSLPPAGRKGTFDITFGKVTKPCACRRSKNSDTNIENEEDMPIGKND